MATNKKLKIQEKIEKIREKYRKKKDDNVSQEQR